MTASVLAVVDVSVLVAGLISKRGGRVAATVSLIDLWWAGAIEPVVCPALVDEFEATLRKTKIARIIPSGDATGYVTMLLVCSQMRPNPSDVPRVCRDPEDDYLFALAAENGVSLVSVDPDVLETESPPCRVLGIGAFLREVRALRRT